MQHLHDPGRSLVLVEPLVHGAVYFKRLYDTLCGMGAGDWVHFTDWRGDADEILTAIDWPFGAAISMGLIVVLLVAVFAYLRVLGRRAEENLGAVL